MAERKTHFEIRDAVQLTLVDTRQFATFNEAFIASQELAVEQPIHIVEATTRTDRKLVLTITPWK